MIVDDHDEYRASFRTILETLSLTDEIFEAANGDLAVEMAKKNHPDIVFMDIAMPYDGLNATRIIHQETPEIKIIILTVHDKKSFIKKAFQLGACGYLLKKSVNQELMKALDIIEQGQYYISTECENNFF